MRSGAYVIGRGSVGSVLVVIGRDVKDIGYMCVNW